MCIGQLEHKLSSVFWFFCFDKFEKKLYILTKNFKYQQKLALVIWLLSFRQRVTIMGKLGLNNLSLDKDDVTDDQILAFYNMATMTMLTGLEVYF